MGRRRKRSISSSPWTLAAVVGLGTVLAYPYVIAAIAALVVLCWLLYRWLSEQKSVAPYDLTEIDGMDGRTFEEYVAALFQSLGYRVRLTQASRDFGVDVVAERGREKIAIQVKRYSKAVSLGAVQQAVAGMYRYKCNQCMVVTNNYFTASARELASHSCCELIDRDGLAALMNKRRKNHFNAMGNSPGPDEARSTWRRYQHL